MVAPIQMQGFRREGDQWVFDSVTKGNPDTIQTFWRRNDYTKLTNS